MSTEKERLKECNEEGIPWKRWGPYLTERQWGTVREDYSKDGDAWSYTTHEMARSKSYRWGEEGIGGICDWGQRLCLAFSFWNGKDSILKERIFGLTNSQGNHGEDVKEYFYYLDSTPTHSYMKMLYKYPQQAFPYQKLIDENAKRDKSQPEYELIDTGIFDEDRYFDIFIEYAKVSPNDFLIKIKAYNRGPEKAPLEIIPQLWYRNTWSWDEEALKPMMRAIGDNTIEADHMTLGAYYLNGHGTPDLLFCENETNSEFLYGEKKKEGYFKDGLNNFIVEGDQQAVNPKKEGTKAGLRYSFEIDPGESVEVHLRLSDRRYERAFEYFEKGFARMKEDADSFYNELQQHLHDDDLKDIQRQALGGLLWGKQFYQYDIRRWLAGDPTQPPPPEERKTGRNSDWGHLYNREIISMPDKWEYPWYACWDLAFHTLPLTLVDPGFAKDQLVLMTREWYMHPNGEFPAYEWQFDDVNPPVHAWATWRVYQIDKNYHGGEGDIAFLERVFHKLMINFTWWVNRKDKNGRNLFQGGFLGLDNIGVFDRSKPLPTGGYLNQADGTSWMAMYSLNLMRIAIELALHDNVYEGIASKFFEHFLHIAEAMTNIAGTGMGLWDEEDEFYYDVLNLPNGKTDPLKVRSMVGLIPLFSVETLEPEVLQKLPRFRKRMEWFLNHRPDLAGLVSRWHEPGRGEVRLLSLLRGHRMKCLLKRMLDEKEFFSDYGIRALSKIYQDHPFVFDCNGILEEVKYQPAESDSAMFGGNSNWRGPIWFPVNYLLIESLQKFHHYYGDDFKIECPTGSGKFQTILEVSEEVSRRLIRIFTKDNSGNRAVFSQYEKLQKDPHFNNYILFHEYFHGCSGRGVGASHQTGWTGLVAKLIQPRPDRTPCHKKFLKNCKK